MTADVHLSVEKTWFSQPDGRGRLSSRGRGQVSGISWPAPAPESTCGLNCACLLMASARFDDSSLLSLPMQIQIQIQIHSCVCVCVLSVYADTWLYHVCLHASTYFLAAPDKSTVFPTDTLWRRGGERTYEFGSLPFSPLSNKNRLGSSLRTSRFLPLGAGFMDTWPPRKK